MARPLRLEFPGALYHVMSRGNRREAIYTSSTDFQAFLECLGDACNRFNWTCHAYCLMTNHYHLLVETPDGNLSRGMRHLNGVYSQTFNRSHGKVGHLFQGRYKAVVVQKERYLLELARYIVLNPLRARMVSRLEEWPWSSYPAMLGTSEAPVWLQVNNLLRQFAPTFRRARTAYATFVAEGANAPSPVTELAHQLAMGDEAFRAQLEKDAAIDQEITRSQRRAVAKPLAYYARSNDRDCAVVAAYASGAFTQKEIADFFNVHYATVSRILARHRAKTARTAMLQCKVPSTFL